ncbi:DUF6916 family protein [Euzebya tangerina]|uniref:DUF6916 family protein n=1 Tax=Euzebya tangerina TaxID=591198 RepID=UPI000E322A2A|nr:hypothetical protein [Euzebya tangerina]
MSDPDQLDQLTCETFSPHVGSTFCVGPVDDGEGRLSELRLAAAEVTGTAPSDRRQPFSLIFVSDDATLPQGTYRLTHAELPDLAVFLVPIGPADGAAMRYEAVFN